MYLLDTFAVITLISGPDRMRLDARDKLASATEPIYFSPISVWEIEIKAKLGKLERPAPDVAAALRARMFTELPVTSGHAERAGRLVRHHNDPFDRMLIAQAQHESLTIVTPDRTFAEYAVRVLPC